MVIEDTFGLKEGLSGFRDKSKKSTLIVKLSEVCRKKTLKEKNITIDSQQQELKPSPDSKANLSYFG